LCWKSRHMDRHIIIAKSLQCPETCRGCAGSTLRRSLHIYTCRSGDQLNNDNDNGGLRPLFETLDSFEMCRTTNFANYAAK
jgi:hypothetical protein